MVDAIDSPKINTEQFKLLLRAKTLIWNEFAIKISLQNVQVLNQIHLYAMRSKNEELRSMLQTIKQRSLETA